MGLLKQIKVKFTLNSFVREILEDSEINSRDSQVQAKRETLSPARE